MPASPHILRFIPTAVKNVHIYYVVQDKSIISSKFCISELFKSNKIQSRFKQKFIKCLKTC